MINRSALNFETQRQALAQAATPGQGGGGPNFGNMRAALQSAGGLLSSAMQPTRVQDENSITRDEVMSLMSKLQGYGNTGENQYSEMRSRIDELSNSSAMYKPQGEIGQLILDTANAMGADPVDLATAISYETAGTFDPTKAGPKTQWGRHRGLIQFGEPQAKEYGVNWDDPLYSQLGEGKAVQRYFEANGWKRGMSGLDLYSIINAGAPGRYGASDANNGGAPGSVRDKWENQMGGHRIKAARMLGLM